MGEPRSKLRPSPNSPRFGAAVLSDGTADGFAGSHRMRCAARLRSSAGQGIAWFSPAAHRSGQSRARRPSSGASRGAPRRNSALRAGERDAETNGAGLEQRRDGRRRAHHQLRWRGRRRVRRPSGWRASNHWRRTERVHPVTPSARFSKSVKLTQPLLLADRDRGQIGEISCPIPPPLIRLREREATGFIEPPRHMTYVFASGDAI